MSLDDAKNLFFEQWNMDMEELLEKLKERGETLISGTPQFEEMVRLAESHMSPANTASELPDPDPRVGKWSDLRHS